MDVDALRDDQWARLEAFVPGGRMGGAKKGDAAFQGLGRSSDGHSTKLQAVSDGLGLPVRSGAGPSQENDLKQAGQMIADFNSDYIIADRAYDADALMEMIRQAGGEPVIAPRRHRKAQHAYDKDLYKERNQIERLFAKLKEFRHLQPAMTNCLPTSSVSSKSQQSSRGSNSQFATKPVSIVTVLPDSSSVATGRMTMRDRSSGCTGFVDKYRL